MKANRLLIAAAGSGKTTYLVNQASKLSEHSVLVTTYTEANELEIRKRFGSHPPNITVQTWFSFLLQHGVYPYQNFIFDRDIKGLLLVNEASGVKYSTKQGFPVGYNEEEETELHYLSTGDRIYSDKISKLVCRCNEKSNGAVLRRLAQIYSHVFVDEVQDLAGYDLELIRLMMKAGIEVCLVGDPRQVTYLTHQPKKFPKYKGGKIRDFILTELPKTVSCLIDETTLSASHRNNAEICALASKLYPNLTASFPCDCLQCEASRAVSHRGTFVVHPDHVEIYLSENTATQLRWDKRVRTSISCDTYNFGNSKGLGFDHILIYPTVAMRKWLADGSLALSSEARAKFYVAITRARHSVAIVSKANIVGFERYAPLDFDHEDFGT